MESGLTIITKKELERKVKELGSRQPWNHNILLPYGVETRPGPQFSHGKNLVKWNRIRPILEIIGIHKKRVLDVGCNEGFFTFQLANLGGELLGIDIDPQRIEKAQFVREVLNQFKVDFRVLDIYSEEFDLIPHFDFCLCMGFLHRIPDPFSAINRLAGKSNLILFEWKALKFGHHDEPFAYFSPGGFNQEDYFGTQYWLLSYRTLETILERVGFRYFYRVDDPIQRRALLVAGKIDNSVFHQPDVILHRGRIRALLSHTKRYIRTVEGIFSGRINS